MRTKRRVALWAAACGLALAACSEGATAPSALDPAGPSYSFCAESDDACLTPRPPVDTAGNGAGTGGTQPIATGRAWSDAELRETHDREYEWVRIRLANVNGDHIVRSTIDARFTMYTGCSGSSGVFSTTYDYVSIPGDVGQYIMYWESTSWIRVNNSRSIEVRAVHTWTAEAGYLGPSPYTSAWRSCYG